MMTYEEERLIDEHCKLVRSFLESMPSNAEKVADIKQKSFQEMISNMSKNEIGELVETVNCFHDEILTSGVYFLKNQKTDLIKIGFSKDIKRRVKNIQSSIEHNGYRTQMKLIAVHLTFESHGRLAENSFHSQYSQYREVGEWFRIDEAQLVNELMLGDEWLSVYCEDGEVIVNWDSSVESLMFTSNPSSLRICSPMQELNSMIDDLYEIDVSMGKVASNIYDHYFTFMDTAFNDVNLPIVKLLEDHANIGFGVITSCKTNSQEVGASRVVFQHPSINNVIEGNVYNFNALKNSKISSNIEKIKKQVCQTQTELLQ